MPLVNWIMASFYESHLFSDVAFLPAKPKPTTFIVIIPAPPPFLRPWPRSISLIDYKTKFSNSRTLPFRLALTFLMRKQGRLRFFLHLPESLIDGWQLWNFLAWNDFFDVMSQRLSSLLPLTYIFVFLIRMTRKKTFSSPCRDVVHIRYAR